MLQLTFIFLAVIDAIFVIYSILMYWAVTENGSECYVNANHDWPYSQAMVDDPLTYPFASEPTPVNVVGEMRTVV